jgi:hypothetical protein
VGADCYRSRLRGSTIKADPVQLNHVETAAPHVPVSSVWRTIRGFVLWSYERGSVQYDFMVTLILLFVFLSPRLINFNDHPVERNPRSTGVVVYPDNAGGFVYQVDAKAIQGGDDAAVRNQLLRVIEPISGSVSITRYEPVADHKGYVIAYKVWAERE